MCTISITSSHRIQNVQTVEGIQFLRDLFPDGKADDMNFVLFSTSGVHGSYYTIEDAEFAFNTSSIDDNDIENNAVTFLVIKPRVLSMLYGNVIAETLDDFEFLKRLRKSSKEVLKSIGEYYV